MAAVETVQESSGVSSSLTEQFQRFDNFIFDCDGVLWNANVPIEGSIATVKRLREMGKKTKFVTNNSIKSRESYLKKFEALGLPVAKEDIVTTSWTAVHYLTSNHPTVKKVYVIGESGIHDELREANLIPVLHSDVVRASQQRDSNRHETHQFVSELDPQIGAVICGFDYEFSLAKTRYACHCIRYNKGSS